jgi:hypothetical protein
VFAEVFRWVDKDGKEHYSDKYTADEAENDREKIDPYGKRAPEFQEGAKTPEQIARENRLRELRREQLRLLVEERDHDQSLLRTYRSEGEMLQVMEGKLATIDGIIKVTQTNQQRQERLLESQHKQAADLERRGQPVQKGLRENIDATNRQIAAYKEKVRNLEVDKAKLKDSYAQDVARFRYLLARRENFALSLFDWTEQPRRVREKAILSAIKCQTPAVCDRVWDLARTYLKQVSNRPLVTDTARLMHTEGPVADGEISAIVVRVLAKDIETIFFDTRCRNSSLGDELCASETVDAIRSGFEPFVRRGLGLTPQ